MACGGDCQVRLYDDSCAYNQGFPVYKKPGCGPADGDDADFYVACAVDFIKDTAKRCAGELLLQIQPAKTGPKPKLDMGGHTQFGILLVAATIALGG